MQETDQGFSGGTVVKNLPANAGDLGSIPGSGRLLGGGHGNPLQYSCLENPMDRGSGRLQSMECTKSQTWLSTHTHTHTDIKAKPTKLHKLFVNNCNWSCKKSGCLLSKDWVWHSCTITRGDPETLRWQLPADLVLRMAGGVLEPDTVQKRSRGSQGCRNASETTSTWPPSSSMDAWTTATPFWFFFFFWHFTNVLFYFIFLWFVIFLFFIYFFYLMFGKTNTVFHFDF